LQEFSSFEASVFVRFMERIGKLLAYGLLILSILFFWIYSSEKSDREKQQQEVKIEQSVQRGSAMNHIGFGNHVSLNESYDWKTNKNFQSKHEKQFSCLHPLNKCI